MNHKFTHILKGYCTSIAVITRFPNAGQAVKVE